MDIFILLLISLFVYLIPRTDVDYLSNKSTKSLKGLLALLIIFHHISQKITTGENFSNFEYMGRYIVALFFFLSGYGLYFQYSNNATYMENFLKKRLVRIFIPFFVFIVIYVIYRATLGEVVNVDFFLSFWKDHSNIIYIVTILKIQSITRQKEKQSNNISSHIFKIQKIFTSSNFFERHDEKL